MSSTPRVSVCIATYNGAELLSATLDSVWAQDYDHYEVVIVDDGSARETLEVLEAQTDPRLRVFRHRRNRGQSAAVDATIALARGEYVKFLDQDDLLRSDCLRKMTAALDEHPDAAFVFSRRNVLVDDPTSEITQEWLSHYGELQERFRGLSEINDGIELLEQWTAGELAGNWIAEPAGVMIRRDRFGVVGGYSKRVRFKTDGDMWARLMSCGNVAFLDEPLYSYRFAVAGMTGDAMTSGIQWLDDLWTAEELFRLKVPVRRLEAVRSHLVAEAFRRVGRQVVRREPGALSHVRELLSYLRYRAGAAVGRAVPLHGSPIGADPDVERDWSSADPG